MLHQPRSTVEGARKVCFDIHEEAGEYPYGVGFQYDKVATVTVSGLLKWTNMVLERAPEGRQDVLDTGPVRIEIFDSKDARKYLDNRKAMFSLLGISFIDYK